MCAAFQVGERVDDIRGFEGAVSPANVGLGQDPGGCEALDRRIGLRIAAADQRGGCAGGEDWCPGDRRDEQVDGGVRADASYADLPSMVRLDEKRSGEAELGGGNREDAAPENWCSGFFQWLTGARTVGRPGQICGAGIR